MPRYGLDRAANDLMFSFTNVVKDELFKDVDVVNLRCITKTRLRLSRLRTVSLFTVSFFD